MPFVLLLGVLAAGITAAITLWPKDPRKLVVQLASGELGSKNALKYWTDVLTNPVGHPKEWCGAFALWTLKKAGLTDWNWEVGKGFLYKLPRTTTPQPGDIAYFDAFQHQAVVKAVRGNMVTLLNGNGTGGAVTETTIPIEKAAAYYSIEPLLQKKS